MKFLEIKFGFNAEISFVNLENIIKIDKRPDGRATLHYVDGNDNVTWESYEYVINDITSKLSK